MKFEFSEIKLPLIDNRMKGQDYERFKRTLVGLLMTQRAAVFNAEESLEGAWKGLGGAHLVNRLNKLPEAMRDQPGAVKILQDTGVLRNSFTDGAGSGSEQRIEETSGDEVRLATAVPYAKIQNDGGTINWPGTQNGFGR